jgi:hypothetical protein
MDSQLRFQYTRNTSPVNEKMRKKRKANTEYLPTIVDGAARFFPALTGSMARWPPGHLLQ